MGRARLLVDRAGAERPPRPAARGRARLTLARKALAVAAVVAATLAGSYLALASFQQERQLLVGEISLRVSVGHRGALDIYVPLVDWGARFEAIRFPARLHAD